MYRIITSAVTDPSIQQPFTAKSLDFLQDYIKNFDNQLAYSMYSPSQSSFSPFAMWGCTQTGNVIASGTFFGGAFNPEIFELTGADITGYGNPALVVPVVTHSAIDPITFSDNIQRSVHRITKYAVVDLPAGVAGSYLYSDFIFKSQPNYAVTASAAWTGQTNVYLDNGVVYMKGIVSILGSGSIATLPAQYRPVTSKSIPAVFNDDGTYKAGLINISTGGAITFVSNFTGSSIRGVYFDGVSFFRGL